MKPGHDLRRAREKAEAQIADTLVGSKITNGRDHRAPALEAAGLAMREERAPFAPHR